MMMQNYSVNYEILPKIKKYKLVFLGEQNVGKTSMVTRFMYDSFESSYNATIGIDFLSKTMYFNEKSVRLQLWDTAGQERFRSLIPSYIRDSSVAIIVYDITNLNSFIEVDKWIMKVKEERNKNVLIILVGNKSDLNNLRKISCEDGLEKAKIFNILFIETSAKSGNNIKLLFKRITEILIHSENTFTMPEKDQAILLNSIPQRNITETNVYPNCYC